MSDQPDIPVAPSTPATTPDRPPPPSSVLNQGDKGMVSQADLQANEDERLMRDRRDNLNPSLARAEPVDTAEPTDGTADEAGGQPARG
jgi:hypothetical protein